VIRKTAIDFTLGKFADPFGYGCDNAASAAFQEAANALTVPGDGDDESVTAALPFTFRFYGVDYTTAFISTNGVVNFLAANTSTNNAAIPTTGNPNAAIYAYWDDLHVDSPAASLRTETLGLAPNRRFVVEWRNVSIFGDPSRRLDISLTLFENGQILTQTRNLADDARERGSSATLGIENATGTVGLRYSFNQAVLPVGGSSIFYRPPV
jgi:hypothetical protein